MKNRVLTVICLFFALSSVAQPIKDGKLPGFDKIPVFPKAENLSPSDPSECKYGILFDVSLPMKSDAIEKYYDEQFISAGYSRVNQQLSPPGVWMDGSGLDGKGWSRTTWWLSPDSSKLVSLNQLIPKESKAKFVLFNVSVIVKEKKSDNCRR
jgi:hypothetical protein